MPGHNNPPPLELHSLAIEELFELANGLTGIETDEQEADADQLLDEIRKAKKAADEARKIEKQPHLDASRRIDEAYRAPLLRADLAVDHVKRLLTPYRVARQARLDKEAEDLRKAAQEANLAAQEAFSSDDLEAKLGAEGELRRSRIATAQANKIDRAAKGLRTSWEAEIVDHRAALNYYVKREPQAFIGLIKNLADRDARGARQPVPGIVYHERKKAA